MEINRRRGNKSAEELGFNVDKIKAILLELGKEPKDGRLVWKDEIGGDVEFK